MRRLKILASIIAAVGLVGCVSVPPAIYHVENSRSYPDKSYDEVWENLLRTFATKRIQIKGIAKDSGVIYTEAGHFDDSIADCGKPVGLFISDARRATFTVFVTKPNPRVTVNMYFQEVQRYSSHTKTVICSSKGTFEKSILDLIEK